MNNDDNFHRAGEMYNQFANSLVAGNDNTGFTTGRHLDQFVDSEYGKLGDDDATAMDLNETTLKNMPIENYLANDGPTSTVTLGLPFDASAYNSSAEEMGYILNATAVPKPWGS